MWFIAYSDFNENVNEDYLVSPEENISLEILAEPCPIISQLPKKISTIMHLINDIVIFI